MSIQAGLYAFLAADAGVSALVGNRIYPLLISQQEFDEASKRPCLVYQRTGLDRSKTFCETIDLQRSTFSIDCYARQYVDAINVAAAVKTALIDYVGPMGSSQVRDVTLENEFDLLDLEPGLFRVALSFFVWHAE